MNQAEIEKFLCAHTADVINDKGDELAESAQECIPGDIQEYFASNPNWHKTIDVEALAKTEFGAQLAAAILNIVIGGINYEMGIDCEDDEE